MQQLVNKIYRPKMLDKVRPVSRFEYEQKDVRHKLDIADIYLQLGQIQAALEKQGITLEVPQLEEQEGKVVEMVLEDRKAIEIDLLELAYQRRIEAHDNGAVTEKMRRFLFGEPKAPIIYQDEIQVPVSNETEKEEKYRKIMETINSGKTADYKEEDEKISSATAEVLNTISI